MAAWRGLSAACVLLLAWAGGADAQLSIRGETRVAPYKIVRLQAVGQPDKAAVVWRYDKKALDGGRSGDRLWLTGPPGTYSVEVMSIRLDDKGNTQVDEAEVTVMIGTPGPAPGPTPPVPPVPPVPPDPPPPPAPIPAEGFRVLIVEDAANRAKLPPAQLAVLFDKGLRDYLDAHCALGRDGKTREWRIWDKGVDASQESKLWQDALKRERKAVPWVVISTGKAGYEGPLPATVEEAMALFKKYGGE